jgi:hypothetical protein
VGGLASRLLDLHRPDLPVKIVLPHDQDHPGERWNGVSSYDEVGRIVSFDEEVQIERII